MLATASPNTVAARSDGAASALVIGLPSSPSSSQGGRRSRSEVAPNEPACEAHPQALCVRQQPRAN